MLELGGFREIVRAVTTGYPIPFAFATFLAFALTCLGFATFGPDTLRWVLVGFGGFAFLGASALMAYAVLRKPDLLRSEHHVLAQRVLQIAEDSDLTVASLERIGKIVLDGQERSHKKHSPPVRTLRDGDSEDSHEE
jgi:hypothetical protein